MIKSSEPLAHEPRRILVAGVTGSGKSTLARLIAGALNIPYTELDALYHGPNWTRREQFLADVAVLASNDKWITEWQYSSAREQLTERADTMIWLDYPIRVSLTRLILRTLRRRHAREVLWNGNIEPPLWHFFTGRDHIIAWALKTQFTYRKSVPALEGTYPQLQVVRLRSQAQTERWLRSLAISRRG